MQAITKADTAAIVRNEALLGADAAHAAVEGRGQKVRAMLKARLGEEIYSSWFKTMEFESFDGRLVRVSVPVKFVRNWIHEHYSDNLLECARTEFATAERIEVVWRQPGAAAARAGTAVARKQCWHGNARPGAAGINRALNHDAPRCSSWCPHFRWWPRRFATRSALYVRQLRCWRFEPHVARWCDPGC
jgi:DnaA N-terminal domain